MGKVACVVLTLSTMLIPGCGSSRQDPPAPKVSSQPAAQYALHAEVTATVFWVGEPAGPGNTSVANVQSAWDDRWQEHFGGVDDPRRRQGSRPADFVPKENPFYFALPYNDFAGGRRKPGAAAVIPWARERAWGQCESMCKNRWIRITRGSRTCYAQWEDVGPFRTDDAAYVFGSSAPQNQSNKQAGLDVSPAVRDYLALGGMDKVNWSFVEAGTVPDGPWKEIVTTSQTYWR